MDALSWQEIIPDWNTSLRKTSPAVGLDTYLWQTERCLASISSCCTTGLDQNPEHSRRLRELLQPNLGNLFQDVLRLPKITSDCTRIKEWFERLYHDPEALSPGYAPAPFWHCAAAEIAHHLQDLRPITLLEPCSKVVAQKMLWPESSDIAMLWNAAHPGLVEDSTPGNIKGHQTRVQSCPDLVGSIRGDVS
ncbi:unnamed protein product [Cladocopium goreaui]|uniref:Uncharacterized protein n=1 Tax=Cladocopium goreaui TaxID=2562237 RepID=A0A9P1DM68_9DINO|nr:unnamed protein product [Cladocopium goreaui]